MLERQVLCDHATSAGLPTPDLAIQPQSVATALAGPRRLLSLVVGTTQTIGVVGLDASGGLVPGAELSLFQDLLAGFDEAQRTTTGVIGFRVKGKGTVEVRFDDLVVTGDRGVLYEQDFSAGPPDDWTFVLPPPVIGAIGSPEFVDGALSATVSSALVWSGEGDPDSRLVNLAVVDGTLALAAGATGHSIGDDGLERGVPSLFSSPVSDLRVWKAGGRPWMGACLLQESKVVYGRTAIPRATGEVRFPTLFGVHSLGLGAGPSPGRFLFPVSFDVGPDGRFFVLDAGNSRVEVFDAEGGYVYVADVQNRRIQKFAP